MITQQCRGWPKRCTCPSFAVAVQVHDTPANRRRWQAQPPPRRGRWAWPLVAVVSLGVAGWAGVPGLSWAGTLLQWTIGGLIGLFLGGILLFGFASSRP